MTSEQKSALNRLGYLVLPSVAKKPSPTVILASQVIGWIPHDTYPSVTQIVVSNDVSNHFNVEASVEDVATEMLLVRGL